MESFSERRNSVEPDASGYFKNLLDMRVQYHLSFIIVIIPSCIDSTFLFSAQCPAISEYTVETCSVA